MKPVLVDTSVWVLHLATQQALVKLFEQDAVPDAPADTG